MKTALQQFIEWGTQMIGDYPANKLSFYEAIDKAEEFLEVEKDQIIEAFWNGDNSDCTSEQNSKEIAGYYYNETYGKGSS